MNAKYLIRLPTLLAMPTFMPLDLSIFYLLSNHLKFGLMKELARDLKIATKLSLLR